MRVANCLVALLAVLSLSCSAIDDFGKFTFGGGGDGGATDGGDDGPSGLLPFGAACMPNQCDQYLAIRPTLCEQRIGGSGSNVFPDGMCTRTCTLGVAACSDYAAVGGGSDCAPLFGMDFCLPRCNVAMAPACRKNYNCCSATGVTTGPGVCVPSDACH